MRRPQPAGMGNFLSRDVDVGRPVRVLNTEDTAAPSFAALEVFGWDAATNCYSVRKATVSGRNDLLFNGPIPIPAGLEGQAFAAYPAGAAYQVTEDQPEPGQVWGIKKGEWTLSVNYPGYVVRDVSAETRGFMIVEKMAYTTGGFINVTGIADPGDDPALDDLPEAYVAGELLVHDPVNDEWVHADPPIEVWFTDIYGGDVPTDGEFYSWGHLTGYVLGKPVYSSGDGNQSPWKNRVRVATTVSGNLSTDYVTGSVVDGVTLAKGDSVFIKNNADASKLGVYIVKDSGPPRRRGDLSLGSQFPNACFFVREGELNHDSAWVCKNDAVTIDVTGQTWQIMFQSGFFARLAGGGGTNWTWVQQSASGGTFSDSGPVNDVNLAAPIKYDGTNYYTDPFIGMRVWMHWGENQLEFFPIAPFGATGAGSGSGGGTSGSGGNTTSPCGACVPSSSDPPAAGDAYVLVDMQCVEGILYAVRAYVRVVWDVEASRTKIEYYDYQVYQEGCCQCSGSSGSSGSGGDDSVEVQCLCDNCDAGETPTFVVTLSGFVTAECDDPNACNEKLNGTHILVYGVNIAGPTEPPLDCAWGKIIDAAGGDSCTGDSLYGVAVSVDSTYAWLYVTFASCSYIWRMPIEDFNCRGSNDFTFVNSACTPGLGPCNYTGPETITVASPGEVVGECV